jgi:hypothetical protein
VLNSLAEDRNQWRFHVNTAIKTEAPYKARNLKEDPVLWSTVWTAFFESRKLLPPCQVTSKAFLKKPTAAQEVNKFSILHAT